MDADDVGQGAALAYALREGIVHCHRFNLLQPYFMRHVLVGVPDGLTNDAHLPSLTLESSEAGTEALILRRDVWEVPDDVSELIRDACRDYSDEELDCFSSDLLRSRNPGKLKLELPLVEDGDGETQTQFLIRRIKTPQTVCLNDGLVPMDNELDADKGEGLEFPRSAFEFAEKTGINAGQESLEPAMSTIEFIAEQLRTTWLREDNEDMLGQLLPRRRRATLDLHVTPPVSPKLTCHEPFIPESETCQIDTPSDPASLISDDLRAAEELLFDNESDLNLGASSATEGGTSGKSLPASSTPDMPIQVLRRPRPKLEDLKIELPILRKSCEEPPKVSLACEDMFKSDSTEPEADGEMFEREIWAKFHSTNEDVKRRVEQERLDPRDGLARLRLPLLDFSPPEMEWNPDTGDDKAMFQYIRSRDPKQFELPSWPGGKQSECELPWGLGTSSAARVSTQETLPVDKQAIEALLAAKGAVLTSASFVRKTEKLTILRDHGEDYDEDLMPVFAQAKVPAPTPRDLMNVIRESRRAPENDELAAEKPRKRRRADTMPQSDDELLLTSHHPDGAKLLASFITAKGRPFSLHHDSGNSANQTQQSGPGEEMSPLAPKTQPAHPPGPIPKPRQGPRTSPEGSGVTRQKTATATAPVPPIESPGFPIKLVIPITLPREVVRSLHELVPGGVELIERDYDAHNSSLWIVGAPGPSTVHSPMKDEADIIVSPATGIVLTSIVKARQQPVAGVMGGQNSLLRSVHRASRRYERLALLVSDGSLDDSVCDMSPADEAVFAGLQAFAGGLAGEHLAEVTVHWVGGGQVALAKWVVALACSFARRDAAAAAPAAFASGLGGAEAIHEMVVQVETRGELFLRRAGMNVFAAQVVCELLKREENGWRERGTRFEDHGLAAFVSMLPEERVQWFAPLLGGRRILDWVSQTLEQGWF